MSNKTKKGYVLAIVMILTFVMSLTIVSTFSVVYRYMKLTERGIEEMGTHEELIQKGGIYKELYQLYATM